LSNSCRSELVVFRIRRLTRLDDNVYRHGAGVACKGLLVLLIQNSLHFLTEETRSPPNTTHKHHHAIWLRSED
jgi:hypothetical protein